MTSRGDPLETVNAVAWTVDELNDAFQLTGSAVLGVGMLALARVSTGGAREGEWRWTTLAVGLVLLATAAAYAARSFDLVDLLLVAGGALLLPAWLVWTGRVLNGAAPARARPV